MGGRILHQRFTDSKKDEIGLLMKYQMTLASPKDISFWHFGESLPFFFRNLSILETIFHSREVHGPCLGPLALLQ
jgi:hypothetical protein